jgi:hypothetical protein
MNPDMLVVGFFYQNGIVNPVSPWSHAIFGSSTIAKRRINLEMKFTVEKANCN